MKKQSLSFILILISFMAAILVGSCSEYQKADPNKQEIFIKETWQFFLSPKLKALESTAEKLETASKGFCATPATATLKDVQDASIEALKALKQQEVFTFGPYREPFLLERRYLLDTWPARSSNIEEYLKNGASNPAQRFNATTLNQGSSYTRGLPAIQYLLYGHKPVITNSDTNACKYLVAMTEAFNLASKDLYQSWDISNPNGRFYAMIHPPNQYYKSYRIAVSDIVNTMWHSIIDIRKIRFGKPSGLEKPNSPIYTGKVEAFYAGKGVLAAKENFLAVKELYIGGKDQSITLQKLIKAKNPQLNDRIMKAFEDSEKAIDVIHDPLQDNLKTQNKEIKQAISELHTLQTLISTNMLQELGLIYYKNESDND